MPAGPVGSVWAANSWSATAWEEFTWADAVALLFVLDLNTRLLVFLRSHYGVTGGDLTTLTQRYLRGLTGEYNARMLRLIQDATDAMT